MSMELVAYCECQSKGFQCLHDTVLSQRTCDDSNQTSVLVVALISGCFELSGFGVAVTKGEYSLRRLVWWCWLLSEQVQASVDHGLSQETRLPSSPLPHSQSTCHRQRHSAMAAFSKKEDEQVTCESVIMCVCVCVASRTYTPM